MNLTESKLGYFSTIGDHILEVAEKWYELKHGRQASISIESFNSTSIGFVASYTTGCRGHYETFNDSFGVSFEQLLTKNIKERIEIEFKQEKLNKEKELKKLADQFAKEQELYV